MLYPLGTFPEEGTLEIGVLTDECGVVFFFCCFFSLLMAGIAF